MIIGAGQMGEACLRHLTKKGAQSILVSNRSFDRAIELATEFGGTAVRFEGCRAAMAGVDIIIASTCCPKTLLHRADIEEAMASRRNRPLILIDISVPRNIDPEAQGIENVYLFNIDDLNAIAGENVRNRERELALCNGIIEARAAALVEKVCFEQERRHQKGAPFHAGWISHPAAVVGGYPFVNKAERIVSAGPVYCADIKVKSKKGFFLSCGILVPAAEDFSSGCGVLVLRDEDAPDPLTFADHIAVAACQASILSYICPGQLRDIVSELNERKRRYVREGLTDLEEGFAE